MGNNVPSPAFRKHLVIVGKKNSLLTWRDLQENQTQVGAAICFDQNKKFLLCVLQGPIQREHERDWQSGSFLLGQSDLLFSLCWTLIPYNGPVCSIHSKILGSEMLCSYAILHIRRWEVHPYSWQRKLQRWEKPLAVMYLVSAAAVQSPRLHLHPGEEHTQEACLLSLLCQNKCGTVRYAFIYL